MKLRVISFLLISLLNSNSYHLYSQSAPKEYYRFIREADSLYKEKSYKQSGITFSKAFQSFSGLGYTNDRYNAACAWALASEPDSAFSELFSIAKNSYYNDYQYISSDSDFKLLHKDKRWNKLLEKIKQNYESETNPLRKKIDKMCSVDQKWRNISIRYFNEKIAKDSINENYIKNKMDSIDKYHFRELRRIKRRYGFPDHDRIGIVGSQNFWILTQHQDDHPKFQKKVLKLMKKKVDQKKASASNYALLLDRIKTNANQLQVYGSQLQLNKDSTSYEPQPTIDPENLNKRRKSVGLIPIEDYINNVNKVHYGKFKKK